MAEIKRNDQGYYCGKWRGKEIRVPSVTTAISPLADYSRVDKELLDRAARFGQAVHKIVELHELGKLDESSLRPKESYMADMTPILEAWKKCKAEQGIVVRCAEPVVVSSKYGYAGRLDVIADVRGVPSLIELKSRRYNPITEKLQTIAYLTAWNECHPKEKVKKRFFCELCVGADNKPNGEYNWLEIIRRPGEPDHLSVFRCSLALSQWRSTANG
jgi:hypothetical protein